MSQSPFFAELASTYWHASFWIYNTPTFLAFSVLLWFAVLTIYYVGTIWVTGAYPFRRPPGNKLKLARVALLGRPWFVRLHCRNDNTLRHCNVRDNWRVFARVHAYYVTKRRLCHKKIPALLQKTTLIIEVSRFLHVFVPETGNATWPCHVGIF